MPAQVAIQAPCGDVTEIEALVRSGADALYTGVFPESWAQRWGLVASPNRRGPGRGNLGSLAELQQVIETAHGLDTPVHLTLNQPYYPGEQARAAVELAQEAADLGVDTLIVADPGLLCQLSAMELGPALHASTVLSVFNSGGLAFFGGLGVRRVILARHLSMQDLRDLASQRPAGVGIEVIVYNDGCFFDEGMCSTLHALPGLGVYCMTPWEYEVHRGGPNGPLQSSGGRWEGLLDDLREMQHQLGPCGFGWSPERLPLGTCGLCALPELAELGVDAVKVVGREASLYRKLRSVQAVRHILDLVEDGKERGEIQDRAVGLRGDPRGCSTGYSCYFRDARIRRSSEVDDSGRDENGPRPPVGGGT
jgi:putative protease